MRAPVRALESSLGYEELHASVLELARCIAEEFCQERPEAVRIGRDELAEAGISALFTDVISAWAKGSPLTPEDYAPRLRAAIESHVDGPDEGAASRARQARMAWEASASDADPIAAHHTLLNALLTEHVLTLAGSHVRGRLRFSDAELDAAFTGGLTPVLDSVESLPGVLHTVAVGAYYDGLDARAIAERFELELDMVEHALRGLPRLIERGLG